MALKTLVYLVTVLVYVHCSRIHRRPHIGHSGNASATVPDKFIAGGHLAKIGQFPWIARLSIKDNTEDARYLCAGSLIGERHVLTAAHCLEHDIKYYQDVDIYLGEYDRTSFPVDCVKDKCTKNWMVNPDKIIKHYDYDRKTISNDIALLRLEKKAPLSAYISIISLPPFDIDNPKNKGMAVAVLGWGKTENSHSSNVLLTTELSMIPKNECPSDVPKKHLCAGDPNGKDTCPGDSGGPLIVYHNNKYYLSGVVSYGPALKCGTSKMGYYTNVYKYKRWIKLVNSYQFN